jgi:PAS domain S-box-containing protein
MSTSAPAEVAQQNEIERLRARVAELERERQIPAEIVEKSPVMISIVRAPDFIYELVNPAFQALAPGKAFLGRRFADVWAEVSEPLVEILRNVIDTGRTFELEDAPYSIRREADMPPELVYVSYSWIPLPGPDGKPDRVLTLAHETTAAVRLRENAAILRSFFDSAGVMRGIVELKDGCIIHVSCNEAAAKLYGVDRDSIPGKSAIELGANAGVAQAWVGLYEDSRRTGKPVSKEYARRDADGRDRWLLATASYLGDGPSPSPRFAYTILDLTERKRAEEALHKQRQWLEVTLQSIGDAVLAADAGGRVTFFNPVTAKLTGWTEEEALGRQAGEVLRLINLETREEAEDIIGRVLREGCVVGMANHTALMARDGREIPIEDSAAPIRGDAGDVLGVVLVFHDVTERRRAHRELQSVLSSITDGLVVLDRNWCYTYFSEQGARMLGVRREDLISPRRGNRPAGYVRGVLPGAVEQVAGMPLLSLGSRPLRLLSGHHHPPTGGGRAARERVSSAHAERQHAGGRDLPIPSGRQWRCPRRVRQRRHRTANRRAGGRVYGRRRHGVPEYSAGRPRSFEGRDCILA